jgi:hypothetical protein
MVTNPEIIARLAAMRACEEAEREHLAPFSKPEPQEAETAASAPPPAAMPSEAGSEKKEVSERQGTAKSVRRRRNKKSDPTPSEPIAEAGKEPITPAAAAQPAAVPETGTEQGKKGGDEGILAVPAAEEEKQKSGAEEKPSENPVPEEPEKGSLDEKIAQLKSETEDMRARYVKEDYDNTNAWAKVRSFFRLKDKEQNPDTLYWQAQYDNKLIDLQDLELEKIKQSGLRGKELKEAMAGMLRYFKYDEAVSVIDARTRYRAENRGWGERIVDAFGALGRNYNRLSFKEKMALTVLLTGGAMGAAASGGFAAGALATFFFASKRTMGGAAMFAGVEMLLEKMGDKRRAAQADKASMSNWK